MAYRALNNTYITQAAWFISPQTGSDGYDGTSSGFTSGNTGPLKTWAELVRRWGTIAPRLRQNTTITFVTSHIDNSDPVNFAPYIENGVIVSFLGTLGLSQQVATGTLGTVTAKNRSTPQLLNAVLTSGLSSGQLIVNSTNSSRAWLYKNVSGNTWSISQPLVPQSAPITTRFPAEVDIWTAGDTYTVYNPVQVYIASLNPEVVGWNAGKSNALFINSLTVYDPSGLGDQLQILSPDFNMAECSILKSTQTANVAPSNRGPANPSYINCDFGPNNSGGTTIGSGINTVTLSGGQVRSGFLIAGSVNLLSDVIIGGFAEFAGNCGYRTFYIDTGVTVIFGGSGGTGPFSSPAIWGPGILSVTGMMRFSYNTATAVSTFLNTGGLLLNGVSTASAYDSSGDPAIWHPNRTLSALNLDTTVAAGGFGGNAINPGGACITSGVV